jgi:hypothetical protein
MFAAADGNHFRIIDIDRIHSTLLIKMDRGSLARV